MSDNLNQAQLETLYNAFNRRDLETVLATLHPNVTWANGLEGGFVHGRDAVRAYWTKQFAVIQPHLEPLRFEACEENRCLVTALQVVRDLEGNLLFERMVGHRFTMENGVVTRFDIIDTEVQ